MLYCTRCQILAKDEKCPVCGHKTREIEKTDPVLLLIADNLRADMAEPRACVWETSFPAYSPAASGSAWVSSAAASSLS